MDPPPRAIPKVISGLDDVVPGSLEEISRLYQPVFDRLVPVSKPEVAEMVKLYENCQRMMAIAYANEMSDACAPHGINPFEVAKAASSKPFGYLPINPSLGVGGHCIPVNPYYLLSNSEFPLLRAATEKMASRPDDLAHSILRRFEEGSATDSDSDSDSGNLFSGATAFRPRILVVGVGFKAGQSHLVNSPALQLATALQKSNKADVMFVDPLVEQSAVPHVPRLHERHWKVRTLQTFDVVVLAVKQPGLDLSLLQDLQGVRVESWCP